VRFNAVAPAAELDADAFDHPEAVPPASAPVYINELELTGMIVNAIMTLRNRELVLRLLHTEQPILLIGDNTSAVQWLKKAGMTRRAHTAGALMRIMGAVEVASGLVFQSQHLAGDLNDVADYLSRGRIGDPDHSASDAVAAVLASVPLTQVPRHILSTVCGALGSSFDAQATPLALSMPMIWQLGNGLLGGD
jgi:hypothetical protein